MRLLSQQLLLQIVELAAQAGWYEGLAQVQNTYAASGFNMNGPLPGNSYGAAQVGRAPLSCLLITTALVPSDSSSKLALKVT